MKKAEVEIIANLKKRGMEDIAENLIDILTDRDSRMAELAKQSNENFKRYETVAKALDHFVTTELTHYTELRNAFPEYDIVSHKTYHEEAIKANEAKRAFYESLKKDIVSKGLWFSILVLFGIAIVGFKIKVIEWATTL